MNCVGIVWVSAHCETEMMRPVINAKTAVATTVPMAEWVMERWPNLRSKGFEIQGTKRPMVDVG